MYSLKYAVIARTISSLKLSIEILISQQIYLLVNLFPLVMHAETKMYQIPLDIDMNVWARSIKTLEWQTSKFIYDIIYEN